MKTVVVQFSLHLPAEIKWRDRWYVSSCPVLDVHSQGSTVEQAKKNLAEALSLFFISCHERGTLDAVLRDCGFRPGMPGEEVSVAPTEDYIDVPIPFYIDMNNPRRCHA